MFQDRIRDHYEELTPGFRKLADFILDNTLDVAFFTVAELAQCVEVDPATVIRFSQYLAYSGYRELSQEIQQYVHDQFTATYRKAQPPSNQQQLLHILRENILQNLAQFSATETATLAKIVQILKQAPYIWVVGEFMSYPLAALFAQQASVIGRPITVFKPTVTESAAHLAHMQPGQSLFAIATGYSVDTGYAMKLAREKGVTTICLTASATVLPAREADIALVVPIKSPVAPASYAVFSIVLSLIWEALMAEDPYAITQLFTDTSTNIGELRTWRAAVPKYDIPS